MTRCQVALIVPANVVESLKTSPSVGPDIRVFTEADGTVALETIARERPRVVVLGRAFVDTERGESLVDAIRTHPALAVTQVRVLAQATDYLLLISRRADSRAVSGSAVSEPSPDLDGVGTRQARRWRMLVEFEARLDGRPATLVDLSQTGAKVIGSDAVRLNQRVSLSLADDTQSLQMTASVVWASGESFQGTLRYRIGVQFIDADPTAVGVFCARHGHG